MNNREKRKVFIGSTSECLCYAHAVMRNMRELNYDAITWDVWFEKRGPGQTYVEGLKQAVEECEFAIYLMSDKVHIESDEQVQHQRLANLWFEVGLFMGAKTVKHVALFSQEGVDIAKPSNFEGYENQAFRLDKGIVNEDLVDLMKTKKEDFSWDFIPDTIRTKLLDTFLDPCEKIHDSIEGDTRKGIYQYKHVEVLNRDACYEKAKEMIKSATSEDNIYTILSFNGESMGLGSKNTLNGAIKEHIEKVKQLEAEEIGEESFQDLTEAQQASIRNKCFANIKRLVDLQLGELADKAKEFIDTDFQYTGFIDIKDTFCRYIEVVLIGTKVLILFPRVDSDRYYIKFGIYCENNDVVTEGIEHWVDNIATVDQNVSFVSCELIEDYKNIVWPASQRNEKRPCVACVSRKHFFNNPELDNPTLISFWAKAHSIKAELGLSGRKRKT